MTFVYPLALLGLIGVPILIIIYIIKNKYTEQTITSNYIWHLSERFLKNRKPISKIRGLISLILQCLMVVILSILLAHPKFIVKNGAKEYCFILDGSASMNIIDGESSRFDKAKLEIANVIENSYDGSIYTLVYVGNSTTIVYEKNEDKKSAIELLNKQSSAYLSNNYTLAISYAQKYFDNNPSVKTYLITDKNVNTSNIELINVGSDVINYSVTNVEYKVIPAVYDDSNNLISSEAILVSTNVNSNGANNKINVSLYSDNQLIETKEIDFSDNDSKDITFESNNANFDYLEVRIENEDALALDNQYIVYNIVKEHEYKALIVSDYPFYLNNIMKAFGVNKIDVLATKDYNENRGYGLYVFDSYIPNSMPNDGSVWLFDQKGSPVDSGISFKENISLISGAKLELAQGSTSIYKKLTDGMSNIDMYVKEYNRYGQYRQFTTLMTTNGSPVVFSGTNTYGNTEIVFAFNLHNTNLPLTYNYLVLFRNLLDYSFPEIIEKSNYVCGDEITINTTSAVKNIRIETPLKNVKNLGVSSSVVNYKLQEIGSYKIIVSYQDYDKEFNIYSSYPLSENGIDALNVVINGQASNDSLNGTYDNLIIFYVLLALLFVADWAVYCYEQYQLR